MTTNKITLAGCSPTPLASYLKALGVLRLIATPTSSMSGSAADSEVRGFWENERFHLHTRLDSEVLTHFFLKEYAPSPIIAPWNGGSGFYLGDNKKGIEPLAGSKVAPRFLAIADAIKAAFQEIQKQGLKNRPEGLDKTRFVAGLRGCLPDVALDWLDSALALSGDRLNFPSFSERGETTDASTSPITSCSVSRPHSTSLPVSRRRTRSVCCGPLFLPMVLGASTTSPSDSLHLGRSADPTRVLATRRVQTSTRGISCWHLKGP